MMRRLHLRRQRTHVVAGAPQQQRPCASSIPHHIAVVASLFIWAPFNAWATYPQNHRLAIIEDFAEAEDIDAIAAAPDGFRRFDIDRQPMHDAIVKFARQANLQIAWQADDFRGLEAGPVHGEMTAEEALALLLEPLDAAYIFTSAAVVAIRPPPAQIRAALIAENAPDAETNIPAFEPYRLPDRDEITVTGTRLKPLEQDARFAPGPALSEKDVRRSGYNDFLNAIADLPTVNAPTTPENTQTSNPSSGQSFIEIRGLGANRTLILLNGRRTVSNSYTSNRVDLNTIPLDLVERVEFVKGGASAVYGADAIAGAVNIIFDNDFEGLRFRTRGGLSQQGGGEEVGASVIYGKPLQGGRGHLTLYGGIDYEGAIRATERDFALISAEFEPEDNILDVPDFSGFIPGGRFPRPGPDFFFDETGLRDDYSGDENGFAFRPLATLSIPQNRYYASALFRHSIAPQIEAFSETHWSFLDTETKRAPDTLSEADTDFLIPLGNPLVPDVILQDAVSRGAGGLQYRRRLSELGPRRVDAERATLRHWTGLRGAGADNAYHWELAAGYNRHHQDQSRTGLAIAPNVTEALNAEADPDNPGAVRCVSAEARARGCVPLNIFGLNTITQEAADFIRHPDQSDAVVEQFTASGVLSGRIAALPAGSVDAAVGAELRMDRLSVETDAVNAADASTGSQITPFAADQTAFDLFSEIRLPLLADRPLAQSLSVYGALRLTFIDEGPDKLGVSYNVSAAWKPAPALKLDVGYSQSIREPDLTERFSPPRGDTDSFDDPCDGVAAGDDAIVALNCLSDPGVAASIVQDGVFEQVGSIISGPNAGNRDLDFETGRTISARFSLAPDMPGQPKLIVEYFNIEIDNAIEAFSSTEIARQCYLRSDEGRIRFCDLVTRDESGQVAEILNQQLNLIRLESAGIEGEFSAAWPLSLSGLEGYVDFKARWSRLLKLEESFSSPLNGGVIDNDLGEPGAARNTAQFLTTLTLGGASARWRSQYFSPTIDSDSRIELFADEGIANPLFFNIPASWRHDLYLEWRPAPEKIALFAGINNLFNDTGPFFPDGTFQGGTDNHISEFDVVGRFFFAGIEKTF